MKSKFCCRLDISNIRKMLNFSPYNTFIKHNEILGPPSICTINVSILVINTAFKVYIDWLHHQKTILHD